MLLANWVRGVVKRMGGKQKISELPHGKWVLKNGNKPLDLRTLPRCNAKAKSTGKRCGNVVKHREQVKRAQLLLVLLIIL